MSSLQEVTAAAEKAEKAERHLREVVAAAARAGVPLAAIARSAGLSRATVNRWVADS